jgi:hypothetical protein
MANTTKDKRPVGVVDSLSPLYFSVVHGVDADTDSSSENLVHCYDAVLYLTPVHSGYIVRRSVEAIRIGQYKRGSNWSL